MKRFAIALAPLALASAALAQATLPEVADTDGNGRPDLVDYALGSEAAGLEAVLHTDGSPASARRSSRTRCLRAPDGRAPRWSSGRPLRRA